MDIEYLLFLQKLREATNDIFTPFFEQLSLFAVVWLFAIPSFIYWCGNKKTGLYTLLSFYLSQSVNSVIKLTACVYRPWIKDPRIVPAGDAIATATGYSFPSGHTSAAVPFYGGLAITARKKHRLLSVICIILAALTMFSRNYLGVHTPQDVICACLIGILALAAGARLFEYIEKRPEKEDMLLAIGFFIGWLAIFYISVKPYPIDYVDGKPLVDPVKMMRDGFGDIGGFIGLCTARLVEKKFIGFKPAGLDAKGIVTGIVGIVIIQLFRALLMTPIDNILGIHWGHFVSYFFTAFYIIALYPAIIKLIYNQKRGCRIKNMIILNGSAPYIVHFLLNVIFY